MSLGVEVLGLGLRDIVFDVDPATLREKGTPALIQFLAHFYCGQTTGCIKMPLGTDVGLSAGDFVLDGDPVTGHTQSPTPPNF